MPGLASKWADDECLVKAAIEQDSKHAKPRTKETEKSKDQWSKPITVSKNQPLVSKWADAPSLPTPPPSAERRKPKQSKVDEHMSPISTNVPDPIDDSPDPTISLENNPLAARLGVLSLSQSKGRHEKRQRHDKHDKNEHDKHYRNERLERHDKGKHKNDKHYKHDKNDKHYKNDRNDKHDRGAKQSNGTPAVIGRPDRPRDNKREERLSREEQDKLESEMLDFIENLDSKTMDWATFD